MPSSLFPHWSYVFKRSCQLNIKTLILFVEYLVWVIQFISMVKKEEESGAMVKHLLSLFYLALRLLFLCYSFYCQTELGCSPSRWWWGFGSVGCLLLGSWSLAVSWFPCLVHLIFGRFGSQRCLFLRSGSRCCFDFWYCWTHRRLWLCSSSRRPWSLVGRCSRCEPSSPGCCSGLGWEMLGGSIDACYLRLRTRSSQRSTAFVDAVCAARIVYCWYSWTLFGPSQSQLGVWAMKHQQQLALPLAFEPPMGAFSFSRAIQASSASIASTILELGIPFAVLLLFE